MDETRLIEQVRRGEAGAERELYDVHVDRVYRLAYRLTGDSELAQDMTQETFIRAFDKMGQFRGEAAFGTWLRSIATSVIYNGLRKVKRLRQREVVLEEAGLLDDGSREAEPDLKEKLSRAIDDLPAKYRMVFVMHDVEGYTHQEISDAMGTRVGTSKAQLFRARAKLREALAEFAEEWAS
ncbi:MAG: RNA polymerase sigma factor [Gemmatimonadales bacterium]